MHSLFRLHTLHFIDCKFIVRAPLEMIYFNYTAWVQEYDREYQLTRYWTCASLVVSSKNQQQCLYVLTASVSQSSLLQCILIKIPPISSPVAVYSFR